MRNPHHPFGCCCESCLGPDARPCEGCEDGEVTGGEDYCEDCLARARREARRPVWECRCHPRCETLDDCHDPIRVR